MTSRLRFWCGFAACQAATAAFASVDARAPCAGLAFTGSATINLTAAERTLVCGDGKTEGWARIPANQREYFLRAFLQQRGYQAPRFENTPDTLTVDPGRKSFIRRLDVVGLPPGIDSSKMRDIVGKVMTPKALDDTKAALTNALQDYGYACPRVRIAADSATGVTSAEAILGAPDVLDGIIPAPLTHTDPAIFSRYEAFRRGQRFDMRLLSLTAQRTVTDSLFVGAYYDVSCSTAGMKITQRVIEGKPRLYKLGVGFDTEGYAIGKAQWKNSRLDARGSSLEGSLYASFRRETAEASLRESFDSASRFYLKPQVTYERENQTQFEFANAEAALLPGTSRDTENLRADVSAGPSLESIRTVRGPGPEKDTFLSFKTHWAATDHAFEYYAGSPQTGWRSSLDTVSRVAGIRSSFTIHRFSLQGERMWNLGNHAPPMFIAGTRWWAGTTYTDARISAQQGLAPDMRFFLGGDANLRGSALMGLPSDSAGFLTVAYDGLELRMNDVLAYGFQPLVFLDAAMGGRTGAHLDPDVYWSPGAGFRWALPVGSIRGTMARSLAYRRDAKAAPLSRPHWQFFLSFGQEF